MPRPACALPRARVFILSTDRANRLCLCVCVCTCRDPDGYDAAGDPEEAFPGEGGERLDKERNASIPLENLEQNKGVLAVESAS